MYDPLELTRQTARMVCRGTARKYYRFRPARFYGGIATADCLGCNLRCVFCWAWEQLHQVRRLGQFYEPTEVAERLAAIARKKGFSQVRLSGNEPTLGMTHLLEVQPPAPGSGFHPGDQWHHPGCGKSVGQGTGGFPAGLRSGKYQRLYPGGILAPNRGGSGGLCSAAQGSGTLAGGRGRLPCGSNDKFLARGVAGGAAPASGRHPPGSCGL